MRYSYTVVKSSPQEFARPWSGPGQHGVFLRSPKRRRHAGTSQKAYIFKKVFFLRSPKRRRHAVTSQKACIFKRVFFLRSAKRRRHAVTSQKVFIIIVHIFAHILHIFAWFCAYFTYSRMAFHKK